MSIRLGFIGSGSIAISHLLNLTMIPGAEVVALSDISTEAIDTAVHTVNDRLSRGSGSDAGHGPLLQPAAYTDYQLMLRNEHLDAVYICLPPFAHGAPEEAVIRAGLPMFVEKPVSLHLALAADLLGRIRDRDLLVATGYQLRYASHIQKARQLLDGRIVGMAIVTRFGTTPGTDWYRRQDKSGGQMTEMATHQVDLLRYLIGEVETVYAAAQTRINHLSEPDYDIFDVNCTTLRFGNGAVANLATNFITARQSPMAGATLQIFCDDLTLSIGNGMHVSTAGGSQEFAPQEDPMSVADQTFVTAVEQGRPDLIRSDYANGVRSLAVTLANDRSARSGLPVDIPRLLADETGDVLT